MKAIDVCFLLLFINIGIVAMSAQTLGGGLFGGGHAIPENTENIYDISGPDIEESGRLMDTTVGNFFSNPKVLLGAIGGFIVVAWGAGILTNTSMTKLLSMALFSGVFWWVWLSTYLVLNTLGFPDWLLSVATAAYGGVFFIGVLEMTSGGGPSIEGGY